MKNKKNLLKIIISIFSVISLISIYFILKNACEFYEVNQSINALKKDVINKKIDWEKLISINKDIIGWIEIEGTNINYPILQDSNNFYYLKHTFRNQLNSNGSIFTANKNPFQEKETVIYGHNMRNIMMFSELINYLEENFFNTHKYLKFYTPKRNYMSTVISCYTKSETQESQDISSLNHKEKIKYYREKSKYSAINIADNEKIVKLVTCYYGNRFIRSTNKRCYVIASIKEI